MVSDHQVRYLMKFKQSGKSLKLSSLKSGMSEKTARKYLRSGKLPSQSQKVHDWRTRPDPFEQIWDEIESLLELNRRRKTRYRIRVDQKNLHRKREK
jgi:predicted site-specific integrase-resolvase